MPRKARATEPEATPVDAEARATETPSVEAKPARGAKTAAIKAALKGQKNTSPKEIAERLTAAGIPTTAGQVSNVKSLLAKAKAAPAPAEAAAPELPKDAVSVSLLVKAKKLVQELGGVKEARATLNALAQLLD